MAAGSVIMSPVEWLRSTKKGKEKARERDHGVCALGFGWSRIPNNLMPTMTQLATTLCRGFGVEKTQPTLRCRV
jgi:hypothetical protein